MREIVDNAHQDKSDGYLYRIYRYILTNYESKGSPPDLATITRMACRMPPPPPVKTIVEGVVSPAEGRELLAKLLEKLGRGHNEQNQD